MKDMLCKGCGKTMVWGAKAEDAKRAFMTPTGRPITEEEAVAYIQRHFEFYFECPDGGNHKLEMLPFDQLEDGAYYTGECRNAGVARWNAETKKFVYLREKFGKVFPEEIEYWVDALPGEYKFDEYKPYCKIDAPYEIPRTH